MKFAKLRQMAKEQLVEASDEVAAWSSESQGSNDWSATCGGEP